MIKFFLCRHMGLVLVNYYELAFISGPYDAELGVHQGEHYSLVYVMCLDLILFSINMLGSPGT